MSGHLVWHDRGVDDRLPGDATDTTAMVRQLDAQPDLVARLASLRGPVVVLERIARGGGETRWYLGKTSEECRRIYRLLGPGSRVTFYFTGPLRVEPLGDGVIGAMFAAIGEDREIVVGVPNDDDPVSLAVELLSGPSELTEFLTQPQSSGDLAWGPYPDVDEPESETLVLVDRDGIFRPHPH
jgi:hypothetical protein